MHDEMFGNYVHIYKLFYIYVEVYVHKVKYQT